jgi:hypothetical protein
MISDAFSLLDTIRRELRRQARENPDKLKMRVYATDKPDTVRLSGSLDIYELAKAIVER